MTIKQLNSKKINVCVKVSKETIKGKTKFVVKDKWENDWTKYVGYGRRKHAFEKKGSYLQRAFYKTGGIMWRHITKKDYDNFNNEYTDMEHSTITEKSDSTYNLNKQSLSDSEIVDKLQNCYTDKPNRLIMSELKWKYLMRSILRGKNILMTGPSGCGKTMAAKTAVRILERPDFYFNLGATQDPRLTLIGNTHFNKESGTLFQKSQFVKALETPNAVILLDEISRAHPEAWNILMTVLDEGQRYLRLDEELDSPTIQVAQGVCFIATANIGNEYTATRVMDRALRDRFTTIEMDVLSKEEELNLYNMLYPSVNEGLKKAVSEIVSMTRKEVISDSPKITTAISTRMGVEIISLLNDNFTLSEAAEVTIYPLYSNDGGADSERTFMKQLIQKYAVDPNSTKTKSSDDTDGDIELFSQDEINSASN